MVFEIPKRKPREARKPRVSSVAPSQFNDKESCVFSVEIETGESVFFRVGLNGQTCERIDSGSIKDDEQVLTASASDWRMATVKGAVNQTALKMLGTEFDVAEPIALINQSAQGKIYGTRKSRLLDTVYEQTPVIQILDRLIDRLKTIKNDLEPPFIVGLSLGNDELVILYAYGLSGSVGGVDMQISINPYDPIVLAETFAAEKHLDHGVFMHVFSHGDFVHALRQMEVPLYPRYYTFAGKRIHELLAYGAAAAWVVALGIGGWAGFQYYQLESTKKKVVQVNAEALQTERNTGATLRQHIPALAQKLSIDYAAGLAKAGALLPQGGKVKITLEPNGGTYESTIPFIKDDSKLVTKIPSLVETTRNLNMTAPEGCQLASTGIAGGIHDLQRTYRCNNLAWGSHHGW